MSAPPGVMGAISLVTAPPASPFEGQEVILVDSLTAPTYSWRLRYVGAKTSNKWIFVGGAPAVSEQLASDTTLSLTYVALSNAGPSFTIPVAGDYLITLSTLMGWSAGASGNAACQHSFDVGATAAVDADSVGAYFGGNTNNQPMGVE